MTGIFTQIGFDPKALRKLQSCLVAAEAACSKGDFPVVAVESALAAVEGFAAATETAAVPTELAAVVAEDPKAISGAAQPMRLVKQVITILILKKNNKADRLLGFSLLRIVFKNRGLFGLTDNIEHTSCPSFSYNRLKFTIWSFVI